MVCWTNRFIRIQDGASLVNASGKNLVAIVEAVKKVARIIAEISAASQEQTRGLEQVSVAISKMDEVTQQKSSMASATSSVARTMTDQARKLTDLVSTFRTDNSVVSTKTYVARDEHTAHSQDDSLRSAA